MLKKTELMTVVDIREDGPTEPLLIMGGGWVGMCIPLIPNVFASEGVPFRRLFPVNFIFFH